MARPHRLHFVVLFEGDKLTPLYVGEDRGQARDAFNAAVPGSDPAIPTEVVLYSFPGISRRARLTPKSTTTESPVPTMPPEQVAADSSPVSTPAPEWPKAQAAPTKPVGITKGFFTRPHDVGASVSAD